MATSGIAVSARQGSWTPLRCPAQLRNAGNSEGRQRHAGRAGVAGIRQLGLRAGPGRACRCGDDGSLDGTVVGDPAGS